MAYQEQTADRGGALPDVHLRLPEQPLAETFLNQLYDRVVADLQAQGTTVIHDFPAQEVRWPHRPPISFYIERAVFMEDQNRVIGILLGDPMNHNGRLELGMDLKYGLYRKGLQLGELQAEGRQFMVQDFSYHPNVFWGGPKSGHYLRELQPDSADDLALVVSQLGQLGGVVYYDPRFEILGVAGAVKLSRADGEIDRLPQGELQDPTKVDLYSRIVMRALNPQNPNIPLHKPV